MDGAHYSDESDIEEDTPIRLIEGIDLKEFISSSCATFEVNSNLDAALEEQSNYLNNEDLMKNLNFDCLGTSQEDDEQSGAPGDAPFEQLAKKMTNLIDSGKVKKRIIKEGTGDVVPPDALVWINYNGYQEFADEPYDSSFMRNRPHKVRLSQGQLFPGLELGVQSMKKSEIAQFLIHPDLGFGKLGCPPRIPADAELLLHVELVKFIDNASSDVIASLSESERRKLGFPAVLKAAKGMHAYANDLYKKKVVSAAINKYKKAVDLLETTHLANEEEQAEQQKLLLKLYTNLAISYNSQKSARHACIMCQRALHIDPNHSKALFQYGKAQINLGGLDKAEGFLKRAQKIDRQSKEINDELRKLEQKRKAYKEDVSNFAKNAFKDLSSCPKPDSKVTVQSEEEAKINFSEEVVEYLKEFQEDTKQTSIPIPPGCTYKEQMFIKTEAEKLGLVWRQMMLEGQEQIYIQKGPIQN